MQSGVTYAMQNGRVSDCLARIPAPSGRGRWRNGAEAWQSPYPPASPLQGFGHKVGQQCVPDDLLLDVGAAVPLFCQLDVLEIIPFLVSQF
jgi:hypothetical protein